MELSIGILAVIIFVVIFVSVMYNSIVDGHEKVKQAWADVLVQENQKQKILPKLTDMVAEHKEFETEIQTSITELRTAAQKLNSSDIDVNGLKEVETKSSALMSSLNVAVEAYPELKTSDLYKNLMQEITEQNENVGAALRIFNANVQKFNADIQSVPVNFVNACFNKKEIIDMFEEEASAESIGFKPNL